MILNKKLVVLLNLVHFEIKQYVSDYLSDNGFDITPEQFLLMDSLWDKKEGVSQQEAADMIMKDKNSITRLVDNLEKKGYIRRIKEDGDRRVNKLILTEKAMQISEKIQEVAEEAIENTVKDIDSQDLERIVEVMLQLHENIVRQRKGKVYNISI